MTVQGDGEESCAGSAERFIASKLELRGISEYALKPCHRAVETSARQSGKHSEAAHVATASARPNAGLGTVADTQNIEQTGRTYAFGRAKA